MLPVSVTASDGGGGAVICTTIAAAVSTVACDRMVFRGDGSAITASGVILGMLGTGGFAGAVPI